MFYKMRALKNIAIVLLIVFSITFALPVNVVNAANNIQKQTEQEQVYLKNPTTINPDTSSKLTESQSALITYCQNLKKSLNYVSNSEIHSRVTTTQKGLITLESDMIAELEQNEKLLKKIGATNALKRNHQFRSKMNDRFRSLETALNNIQLSSTQDKTEFTKRKNSVESELGRILAILAPEVPQPSLGNQLPHRNPDTTLGTIYSEDTSNKSSNTSISVSDFSSLPVPADLEPGIETQFTPEICALADTLEQNPLAIYEYVRNNLTFEPYYGMRKGATGALQQQGGNASDQAALLVALLRYKQIPARFVTGTVEIPIDRAANWAGVSDPDVAAKTLAGLGIPTTAVISGGKITAVRIEHEWVEAYVPYENYRGQAPGKGQKTWVPMDPSFKKHNIKPGIDITSVTGLEQQNINELVASLGDLSNENQAEVEARLEEINQEINTATGSFTSYIQDNGLENGKLEDIIGGREIIPEHLKILPASLPYKLVTISGKYQSMPADLTDYITLAVGGADPFGLNFSGENDFSYQASAPELYGKRITLSWIPATAEDENVINQYGGIFKTPAYLVELKPQLKIDGRIIATGNPVGLGYRQNFSITIKSAGLSEEKVDNPVTVGGFYCLGLDYQNIAPAELEQISNQLKQFESTVNETNVYTDEILGEMLNGIAKAYFGELDLLNKIAAQQCQVITSRQLSTAITGYGPQVGYMFSSPAQVKEGNLFIDVDRNVIGVTSINGRKENEKAYMLISGVTASSMEHLIFEQITGMPSLSAIKILNEASIRGVPIFTITSENLSELLPRLEVSQSVKTDIQNSINAGRIVIIPQKEFNYYDWEGSGYIVLDPETGAAGYMISGGIAGGSTGMITNLFIVAGILAGLIMVIGAIMVIPMVLTGAGLVLALVGYALALWLLCESVYHATSYWTGNTQAGDEAVGYAVANIIALFLGPVIARLLTPVLNRAIGTVIGRAIMDLLDSAGNTIAKSIISRGFSEEFIESIVRISGSKSLVAAQQAIDELLNLGVSKNLIKEVGERFGQEGLTALARLIKTGGVTEGEISTLLNAGYDMARLEMLAENNLIQAAVQSENIIHNLNNVGNFNSTALQHILQGEINAGGRAVGFHYEGMPYSGGKVIPGTAEAPNSYGVYRAKVEVDGVAKTTNDGYSTFFPKDMSPQEVVDSINEAYSNKVFVPKSINTYRGTCSRGFTIDMYIDKSGNIKSAFPEGVFN